MKNSQLVKLLGRRVSAESAARTNTEKLEKMFHEQYLKRMSIVMSVKLANLRPRDPLVLICMLLDYPSMNLNPIITKHVLCFRPIPS